MADDKQNGFERVRTRSRDVAPPRTRSARKEYRRRNAEVEEETPQKQLWVQIRLLPIWLRVILVLALLAGAAVLGAIVGYGYIGDGEPGDVLKKETWIHILDIINGKES